MSVDFIINIKSGQDIQEEINKKKRLLPYNSSNLLYNSTKANIYYINLNVSLYKGNISIPSGTSFSISSDKGCIIDGMNKGRCITSIGASYLNLNNITLMNGYATSKARYSVNGNTYLSEEDFNSPTKYNGGGCCIMGSTIVTISNVNIKSCYAKGCGGGLYYDQCYNIDSMKTYLFPQSQYIIYKNDIFLPYESKSFNFIYKGIDSTIELKSDNNWYNKGVIISQQIDNYASTPNVIDNELYSHGYILNNSETQSIQENIHILNRRGYQFHLENDTCNRDNTIYIKSNKADIDGGGIYINNVSYYLNGSDMILENNSSNGHGGGICIENSIGSMYSDNFTNGIILNKNNMNMIVINMIFKDNNATVYGGGMYYSDNYNTLIENLIFKGNSSNGAGGGLFIIGNQNISFNKAYYSYNGFYNTNEIIFNGNNYFLSDKGYHNINENRYIEYIKSNEWIEYKDTDEKGSNYNTTNLEVFGTSNILHIPNYYNWKYKGIIQKNLTVVPDTKWYLNIKLNNIIFNNNSVIKSNNFENRYIREDTNIGLSEIFDIPYLTGGGICIFSANNVSINNTSIENNNSDLYGGGLSVFDNIPSINALALKVDNNTSSIGKGNNYLFIGEHRFFINNNLSKGITKNDIMLSNDIFYSDTIYIYSDTTNKGLGVEYYNGIKSLNTNIKSNIDTKNNNFISLYRHYYEIEKGNEFHYKGNSANNLLISQSTLKKIDSKCILNNKGNSRYIDVSNFLNFICRSLYLLNENVIGNNNNNKDEIFDVSGGAIRTDNIVNTSIESIITNNSYATYGGAFANFTKSIKSSYNITNCTFNNCKASNLGGAIFNFIYKGNKGYNNYEYYKSIANNININKCNFLKCSSTNRGGAIFTYYNSNLLIESSIFNENKSSYGNDCYISDQSYLNNKVEQSSIFIEGSTNNSISKNGNIIKGLVYIDDNTTDIFSYNNGYQKGIDKFYSQIKSDNMNSIKSDIIGKDEIIYQLYDYDYIGNNDMEENSIIAESLDVSLFFNSRLVNRYKAIQNKYNIPTNIKFDGILQNYRNANFKGKEYNISFNNIKSLNISRINIDSVNNTFINIKNISNIIVENLVGINSKSSTNAGIIDIEGIKSDIKLNSNIELVSNLANNGLGGAIFVFLKGESSFSIGEKATKSSIVIANNGAKSGGAFYVGSTVKGNHKITTSSSNNNLNFIEYNSATYGGAFYFDNINAGISNLTISNNFANEGGGIYLAGNSNLDISNIKIISNVFNTNETGFFYNKNQALGGGIFISPESYLTINDDVSIENNLMYWGGGIFNDVNIDNPCRINNNGNNFSMKGNKNYNIYIVGNSESIKNTTEYDSIKDIDNLQIESIDVGIKFSNNTNGRFFTYPIKGNTKYDNHNDRLSYLFNDYINNELDMYEKDIEYGTKSSVKSLDIKIYSDTFIFDKSVNYNPKGGILDYININGKMKGLDNTKFQSAIFNSNNYEEYKSIQFTFNNFSKGLDIQNLYFNSFFNKSNSLYEISKCGKFNYMNNYHSQIFSYNTTNFIITGANLVNIKSEFNTCHYISQNKANNNGPHTKGGFIHVDATGLSNSNVYFNSILKSVGSYCYKSSLSIDSNYNNYNLPIGGVFNIFNSNLYINNIKSGNNIFDGNGSIAHDGGFIYKNLDDTKIIQLKSVTIKNFNSYTNGGAISLNRSKGIKGTFSLLNFNNIYLDSCKAINGYGGGIFLNTTKANFNEINIINCISNKGGGGIALLSKGVSDNSIVLTKSSIDFKGNVSRSGSQIYVIGSKLTIQNINMDGLDYLSNLKSQSDFFKGNDGGAIYAESSELILKSCIFKNFGAYNNGGVIYYDSNYKSSQNYMIDITDCSFNNKGNNFITKRGGAIYMINNENRNKSETINISNTNISNYNSTIGGAVFLNNNAERDIILNINNSNIFNNTVKGNMNTNLNTSYEIYEDPMELNGFGGGIFMNNIKSISFKAFKAYNNSCFMNYPNDEYYDITYNNEEGYTDNISYYKSDINAISISNQSKLKSWNDYFIPCGGGIFMMNGIDISDIKSSNSNIINNTPDDIFPSYLVYNDINIENTITKEDFYNGIKSINSDKGYIDSNSHIWSLLTGSPGSNTDYYDGKTSVKSYGTAGRGAIIEFNNKINMENMKSLTYILGYPRKMDEKSYIGSGGKGAYILYELYDKQQIISSSDVIHFNL